MIGKIKVEFDFEHGFVEGIYLKSDNPKAPLVIISNGHNGFYSYGMFPYIQEKLHKHGISSFSYNYSHGGVIGDADYFEDLVKYEQNCMRLETQDLYCVVLGLEESVINYSASTPLYLMAHSRGGVPTIFASKKLLPSDIKIKGLVLVSTIKSLGRWPADMMKEWEQNGVLYVKNNRTKQELPQGAELLSEVKQSKAAWNIEPALKQLDSKILIIHGADDEAVPLEHGESLHKWAKEAGLETQLKIIADTGHTFGTRHPFEGPSTALEQMISCTVEWVNK